MKSSLTRNILANLLGQAALLVLGLLAVKFVFRDLGGDALGLLLFTQTLNTVLCAALDMGISQTLVREVAAHREADPDYVRDLVRTASAIAWGVYVLLAAGLAALAPVIVTRWIRLEHLAPDEAARVLAVLGAGALASLPRSLYANLFRGLQRMDVTNLVEVLQGAAQQGGAVAILAAGGGLRAVIVWYAAAFLMGIPAYLVLAARRLPARALVPGLFPATIRRNAPFAARMASISVLSAVHTQADKLIVSALRPMGPFGLYATVYGALSRLSMLAATVSQAAYPRFAELFQSGDRPALTATYRKLQDALSLALVPLYAAVPFTAVSLFARVFDPAEAPGLLLPATLLAAGFYMNSALVLPYVFSVAAGRPDITVRANVGALVVVLPLTALLVYHLGLTGAALSWIAYHVFMYAAALPRICADCLRMPLGAWFGRWLRAVGLAAGTYGAAWATIAALGRTSGLPALTAWGAATAVYAAAAWRLAGAETREAVEKLLKRDGGPAFAEASAGKRGTGDEGERPGKSEIRSPKSEQKSQ